MSGQLSPGQTFAGYRIERLLGSGGMGAVYLAHHPTLPRLVALKLLRGGTDGDLRARFLREADTAARLDHPNIVTLYDRGVEGDELWIAMQYIDGSDAAEAVRHGALDPARAVHIIGEISAALDHAHANRVIHRDVKPANILLTRAGVGAESRALLTDFGIAKALDNTTALTQTGYFLASLQYAAPEQLSAGAIDHRADVYALGCTLYHFLVGTPPFAGGSAQLLNAHLNTPAPRPSAAGVHPAFDDVIARAMAKAPSHRFNSSGALASAAWSALMSSGRAATTIVDGPAPFTERSPAPPTARVVPPTSQDPKKAYNQARDLERKGRKAEAKAAYLALLDSGDREIVSYANCNLGNLLRAEGDLVAARAALEQSLSLGVNDAVPAAAYNLGMVLEQQGDREGARAAYNRSIAAAADGDPIRTAAKLRRTRLRFVR
ncbi:MAG: protein kinase [Nocardiaceae bacterium]|nr:protein kinase [Nocardiaceae bacterium]